MENIENKVPNGENQDTQNSSFFSENVSSSNGLEVKFPRLRFNTFSSPWNIVTLQNLLCYSKGRCSVKKNFFISTENMLQNYAGVSYYEGKEMVSGVSFSKNDILLANIRPYLKKVWQAEFSGAASTDVLVFHPLKGYPTFIKYIIANDKFINYVMSAVKGSKMPRGDKVHIMSYLTAYPSLLEQQKIANFLSLIDKRIEKQRQLVEALKKYKRGALSRVFNDILQTEKLSDISNFISSSRTLSSTLNNNKGIYPVYDATGVAGYIDHYDIDSDYITIVKDGSGVGRLQKCNKKSSFIGTLGALVAKNCTTDFLYAVLQTIDFSKFVTGMAIPHIYYKDYKNTLIPFPCEIKQHSISQFLKKIDEYIENENKKLSNILTYKQGLLQQMFI